MEPFKFKLNNEYRLGIIEIHLELEEWTVIDNGLFEVGKHLLIYEHENGSILTFLLIGMSGAGAAVYKLVFKS